MNDFLAGTLMLLCVVVAGGLSGIVGSALDKQYDIYDGVVNFKESGVGWLNTTSINTIVGGCENNSRIDKQLYCVQEHVKRFYIYQVRPDDENITFDKLFEDGGDCANWAKFWETVAVEFDLEVKPIRIRMNKNTNHRFSILSNEQGYCNVDQTKVDCFIYG